MFKSCYHCILFHALSCSISGSWNGSRLLIGNISKYLRFNEENSKSSHGDAKKLCKDNSGRLYEPRSSKFKDDHDYQAILTKWKDVKGKFAEGWLGIEHSTPNDATPGWIYSTSDELVTTTHWKDEKPSLVEGNCVVLSKNSGKWYTDSCTSIRHFICEFGYTN